MDDPVDPTLNSTEEPPRNPPLPKWVRGGAYLGLTAGWLAGLIYVLAAFPSIGFEQQSTADGILIAAPTIGAAVGAVIGWLLRDYEPLAHLAAPDWITFKEVKWGWRTGGIAGLFLAQHYIAEHSPLGFYTGSVALVFETFGPLFAAIGGVIGLLLKVMGDRPAPPTTPK